MGGSAGREKIFPYVEFTGATPEQKLALHVDIYCMNFSPVDSAWLLQTLDTSVELEHTQLAIVYDRASYDV